MLYEIIESDWFSFLSTCMNYEPWWSVLDIVPDQKIKHDRVTNAPQVLYMSGLLFSPCQHGLATNLAD